MKIQNEYLIIIDQKKSKGFSSLCNTEERFNEFLCNTSSLKIHKSMIEHNCNKYSYHLKRGEIKEKNQAFFHLLTAFDGETERLSEYKLYIKELKSALSNDILSVTSLRDDVSFYYSQQAYSKIHIIENLMRKFITYFMITNIGTNWIEESSPESIKQALDKSKRNQYVDMLQQLDFIHLGDFLFKTYNNEGISNLFKKIKSLDNSKKMIDIELIEKAIYQNQTGKNILKAKSIVKIHT